MFDTFGGGRCAVGLGEELARETARVGRGIVEDAQQCFCALGQRPGGAEAIGALFCTRSLRQILGQARGSAVVRWRRSIMHRQRPCRLVLRDEHRRSVKKRKLTRHASGLSSWCSMKRLLWTAGVFNQQQPAHQHLRTAQPATEKLVRLCRQRVPERDLLRFAEQREELGEERCDLAPEMGRCDAGGRWLTFARSLRAVGSGRTDSALSAYPLVPAFARAGRRGRCVLAFDAPFGPLSQAASRTQRASKVALP